MAWNDLKAAVAAVIKTNGTQSITGALLQASLNSIIDQVGANYQYVGIAEPTTVPGTPDGNVYYLAKTPGVYANFGALEIFETELCTLSYSGNWVKTVVQNIYPLESQRSQSEKKSPTSMLFDNQIAKLDMILGVLSVINNVDSFLISDQNGNVIFKVDSYGAKAKNYNIVDSTGTIVATLDKSFVDSVLTTASIVDALNSSDSTKMLSARMGNVLNTLINGILDKVQKIYDDVDYENNFILSDPNGNVIFKIDSDGANAKSFNIIDSEGTIVATINEAFANSMADYRNTYFADKLDSNPSNADNNYKGQFIICDNNGNVIFKVDSDGIHSNSTNSLTFEQITSTIAKVYSSASYTKVFFRESKLVGKTILAIGDSLTAANKWQVKAAEILGATQVTHALGGGGIVTFVDGGSNTNGTLAALNVSDVTGKDAIVILGPYNNRSLMGAIGVKTDMYPTQQTLWGQMNYMFKRIYQELTTANNLQCKIFFAGVHAYGAYPYNDKTAYQEYPAGTGFNGTDFNNKLKEICGWNGIQYIDLFNNSGINSYTWNKYQASAQANATNYIGYVNGRGAGINDPFPDLTTLNNAIISSGFINGDKATVTGYTGYYTFNGTGFDATATSSYYPWVADQLHCSDAGYNLIGNYIATMINSFINN